jgi:hypothetical protein
MGALAVAGFVSGGLLAAAEVVLFVVAPSSPRGRGERRAGAG